MAIIKYSIKLYKLFKAINIIVVRDMGILNPLKLRFPEKKLFFKVQ